MAASKNDLEKTGRVNTTVETRTEVVDNTAADTAARNIKWQSSSTDLGGGTTLITHGEPEKAAEVSGEDA